MGHSAVIEKPLDGEPRIAFDDLLSKGGALASVPARDGVSNSIAQRAAILNRAAFDGAGNAHELALRRIRGKLQDGVAMSAEIEERQMRSEVTI